MPLQPPCAEAKAPWWATQIFEAIEAQTELLQRITEQGIKE